MNYVKNHLRYEGKAKRVYATGESDRFIVEFKDDATAFNAQKRGIISGKGRANSAITARLFVLLERAGIATHFLAELSPNEQLVHALEIIPLEVIVRRVVAGSFAQRLGLEEGAKLKFPVLEFCFKSDALGDPLVSDGTPVALGWASVDELQMIRATALRIGELLTSFFQVRNLLLIDFKLEFGRDSGGKIRLADEISPDTCRLWDTTTGERLDKDRFRRDLGKVEEAYDEVLRRVMLEVNE